MLHDPRNTCLNLWVYVDVQTSLVHRVAGRAYVIDGTDDQRYAVLNALSTADYATAETAGVPRRFIAVPPVPDAPSIAGAVHVNELQNPETMNAIFEPLFRKIEANLPSQTTFDGAGEPEVWKATIPDDALFLVTGLLEQPDGTLVPQAGTTHE